jgi:15-cis-phytoene synthase
MRRSLNSSLAKHITRKSKTNFLLSFGLLPKRKRDAISTVYAFCRYTDDIVDEKGAAEEKSGKLAEWKSDVEAMFRGRAAHPLLQALKIVIDEFAIPEKHVFDLLAGMEMDIGKCRYASFAELKTYCYNVASTVGLMSAEIFGHINPSALEYAVTLGIALQLTNIIRDVGRDAREGRIYFPMDEMEWFGYSEAELLRSERNDAFIRLMKFQSERAREYYSRAASLLAPEDHRAFISARVMAGTYYRILEEISKSGYHVFDGTMKLSTRTKIAIALRELFARPAQPGEVL